MDPTLINIYLAFFEGLGLIVSPCILPILPLVLSSSLDGSKSRPFGVTVGFILSFTVFTLFSRKLVQYTGIDLTLIRHLSFVLLALLGIIMLSSYLTEKFAAFTQRLSNIGATSKTFNNPQGGFISGILLGFLIGLIWTPCAGPILAAVIVQTVIQKTTADSLWVVAAFGIGAGIPMLLIALFGRKIMANLTFFKQHSGILRKSLGAIILISVGLMIFSESFSTTTFSSAQKNNENFQSMLIKGLDKPYPAPALDSHGTWINSQPLQLSQLKGKVVLIDFWTYSCINCIRTLPYIKDWYAKYHDKGLVIIGVHAPEFEFEKDYNNVKNAVANDGILYPVVQDNSFVTWQNFHNQYWPAHYLIDKNGIVVYEHFGEGDYDTTENNIRYLLGVGGENIAPNTEASGITKNITPETYLGYAREDNYSSPEAYIQNATSKYSFPVALPENKWALQGSWKIGAQFITASAPDAALKIRFHAKKVFIVMGNPTGKPITVNVLLNGEKVIVEKGADIQDSSLQVMQNKLYDVINLPESGSGVLEIQSSAPGLEVYTFTFGT